MFSLERLSRKQQRALMLSLMLLMVQLTAPDWQASGNMTDYLSPIRGFIDAANADSLPVSDVDGIQPILAKNISDECDALWDQFWNVVFYYLTDSSKDMILYGYAFRRHWYWHNNYGPDFQSFVIWKDYNCEHLYSGGGNVAAFDQGEDFIKVAFENAYNSDNTLVDDIWQWTNNAIQDHLYASLATRYSTALSNFDIAVVVLNDIPLKNSYYTCRVGQRLYRKNASTPRFFLQGIVNRLDTSP